MVTTLGHEDLPRCVGGVEFYRELIDLPILCGGRQESALAEAAVVSSDTFTIEGDYMWQIKAEGPWAEDLISASALEATKKETET